jgi:hypothetical protein
MPKIGTHILMVNAFTKQANILDKNINSYPNESLKYAKKNTSFENFHSLIFINAHLYV